MKSSARVLIEHYIKMSVATAIGYLVAYFSGVQDLEELFWFRTAAFSFLGVGLYFAATAIELSHMKKHLRLVVLAITVGVLTKWLLVAGAWWALTAIGAICFVLSIYLAQIDPLAAKAMNAKSFMSKPGRFVMATISTLDDFVTSLLTVTIVTVLSAMGILDADLPDDVSGFGVWMSMAPTALLFLGGAGYTLYLRKRKSVTVAQASEQAIRAAAVGVGAVLVNQPYTGSAMLGMLWRPAWLNNPLRAKKNPDDEPPTWADAISMSILYLALFMLGMLVNETGLNWVYGAIAGTAAYFANVPVGLALFWLVRRKDDKSFTKADVWLYCLGQQLGITAVVLGLNSQLWGIWPPGALSVIVPAIIVCNTWHFLCNMLYRKYHRTSIPAQKADTSLTNPKP